MILRIALALCLLAAVQAPAYAQTEGEFQQWIGALGSMRGSPAAPRVAGWLDLHARRGNGRTVFIVRPGVGYDVLPWLSLWAGYAWIPTVNNDADDGHEHRAWQQVTLHHRFDWGLSLQSRTRFEQRFSNLGDDVGFRLREFVRVNWHPEPTAPLGIASWNELFVGLNDTDWTAPAGLDQNRTFIGPFLPIPNVGRLEIGYLLAYLRRPGGDRVVHALAMNLFFSWAPQQP